ncbi:MAG: thioredoxin family protein [Candidatus Micrarchaeaceae archaeon]
MAIIEGENLKFVTELFQKELRGEVNLIFFKSEEDCETCKDIQQLLGELAAVDSRLKLTVYDIKENAKEAKFLGVDKAPATVLGGKKIYNAYYFGMPSGYEFSALLEDIIDASSGTTKLGAETKEALKSLKKNIEIKVFVTPTCPYCPRAVRIAHQLAIESSKIKAIMVESMEFPEWANQYDVMAVPKVVINETTSFEGALPEKQFVEQVMKAAGG